MPGIKRSVSSQWLGPRVPTVSSAPSSIDASAPGPAPVLHEGPAVVSHDSPHVTPRASSFEPLPYGRGSARAALQAAGNPQACVKVILDGARADTSKGPVCSRLKLWTMLSDKAGFPDPFQLTPIHIHTVMGALKQSGYRSAAQYLDLAKSSHVAAGHPWTEQLQLAYKIAIRSCKRGLGASKHASALPLEKLADLADDATLAPRGPVRPITSTATASWWMLREVEASRAKIRHLKFDHMAKRVDWLLPSSKTDQAALGAVRSHCCCCGLRPVQLCPYHGLLRLTDGRTDDGDRPIFVDSDGQPPSKAGWADSFQAIAVLLGLPIVYSNGARAYTGHSARATGAQHLAQLGVDVWRIQIFGRWGSDVVLQYIREAPASTLTHLSLETGYRFQIADAKRQLDSLLREIKEVQGRAGPLALPSSAWHHDCETVHEDTPLQARAQPPKSCIQNMSEGGRMHRCALHDPNLHPRHWRTRCGWPFAAGDSNFDWVGEDFSGKRCKRCFPQDRDSSSSPGSSSSNSTSSSS